MLLGRIYRLEAQLARDISSSRWHPCCVNTTSDNIHHLLLTCCKFYHGFPPEVVADHITSMFKCTVLAERATMGSLCDTNLMWMTHEFYT